MLARVRGRRAGPRHTDAPAAAQWGRDPRERVMIFGLDTWRREYAREWEGEDGGVARGQGQGCLVPSATSWSRTEGPVRALIFKFGTEYGVLFASSLAWERWL